MELRLEWTPKQFLNPHIGAKNSPIVPQKVKDAPQLKSKLNVRIEGNMENESCSTTLVDLKTVFEPYPNHKNSPLGPQKVKTTPKLSQN